MIRPVRFGYNTETAVNNAFQLNNEQDGVQEKALTEFNNFTTLLKVNGVDVLIINDTDEPYKPDSIFPNNWISFHVDGTIYQYPMFATNRRVERDPEILKKVTKKFEARVITDLSSFEQSGIFLEGTGSMVLDRDNRIAYACLSPRTHELVLDIFCTATGYTAVKFHATDENGTDIYHTNVMMCIADQFVVVCLEAITNENEKMQLIDSINKTGKAIIPISLAQMNRFAGNMLQVKNTSGEKLLVMSSQAYHALDKEQVQQLESFNRIIHADLSTIETNGGGSARCMMAEIHLPLLQD